MSNQTNQVRRLHSYSIIADAVLDDLRVGKHELLVYMALCRHADKEGSCFPSYQRIADIARLSRKTTIVAVDKLVSLGIVQKNQRKDEAGDSASNLYIITDTPSTTTPIQPDTGGGVQHTPPWCTTNTTGGVQHTPKVSSPEVSVGKKRKNSAPIHSKTKKNKDTITDDTPDILAIIVRSMCENLNRETGWHIAWKAARSTFCQLHNDGLLDIGYLSYVAKQNRVQNEAHFIQALRSNDYLTSWRNQQCKTTNFVQTINKRRFCATCLGEIYGEKCECGQQTASLNFSEYETAYTVIRGVAAFQARLNELNAERWKKEEEQRRTVARQKQEEHDKMTAEELYNIPRCGWSKTDQQRIDEYMDAEREKMNAMLGGKSLTEYFRENFQGTTITDDTTAHPEDPEIHDPTRIRKRQQRKKAFAAAAKALSKNNIPNLS